ncbi:MAG: NAD(P)H-dependent oxidoreductase [Algicola sp.]|nr:NAD(P)H-dependent oxidoreductase [Algicola sp.]
MHKALVITAHPDTNSFNFALTRQAHKTLTQHEWQVTASDLHQMDFDARMGPHDYPTLPADFKGTLAQKQLHALEHQLFCPQIAIEQQKLRQADLVILQFPIWWGSFPAILKGWIERVCAYGFAYGPAKQLTGKQLMLSVTTGGAANEAECQYYLDKITTMANEVFGYMNMEIAAPHFVHGPTSLNAASRAHSLENYGEHLGRVVQRMTLTQKKDVRGNRGQVQTP